MRVKPAPPRANAYFTALIRGGAVVKDDPWAPLDDAAPAPDGADVIVSTRRLLAEGPALARRPLGGRLGVRIEANEAVEAVADHLPLLALVAVNFPAFRDGRGFTTARLLRERYRFAGEVRAVGDVLQDMVFFLLRCGFDALELKAQDPEAAFAQAARAFTHVYQPAADARPAAFALRAENPS